MWTPAMRGQLKNNTIKQYKKLIWSNIIMDTSQTMEDTSSSEVHPLYDKWVLWAHLPHDTNWDLSSYIQIYTMETMEQTVAILE